MAIENGPLPAGKIPPPASGLNAPVVASMA
jgi:hypothetical protein